MLPKIFVLAYKIFLDCFRIFIFYTFDFQFSEIALEAKTVRRRNTTLLFRRSVEAVRIERQGYDTHKNLLCAHNEGAKTKSIIPSDDALPH